MVACRHILSLPTQAELVAKLRDITITNEHPEVPLEERWEVAEFIISECKHSQQHIHLRLLENALENYAAWANGEIDTDWRHLVVASMRDYFGSRRFTDDHSPKITRAERKQHEQEQLRKLIEDFDGRGTKDQVLEAWSQLVGKKKTAFYDRLAELPAEWRERFDDLDDKKRQQEIENVESYMLDYRDMTEITKHPASKQSVIAGSGVTDSGFHDLLKGMSKEAQNWFNSLSD